MFERFTQAARAAVVLAQQEARDAGSETIGAPHLLVGLLADPAGVPALVLGQLGVDATGVRTAARAAAGLDAEALGSLGIDLDEVRRRAEDAFGTGALDERGPSRRLTRGHIPFTREAKQALERSLRAAVVAGDRSLGPAHVLLGLLDTDEGTTSALLHRLGVTAPVDELRRLIRTRLDDAA